MKNNYVWLSVDIYSGHKYIKNLANGLSKVAMLSCKLFNNLKQLFLLFFLLFMKIWGGGGNKLLEGDSFKRVPLKSSTAKMHPCNREHVKDFQKNIPLAHI